MCRRHQMRLCCVISSSIFLSGCFNNHQNEPKGGGSCELRQVSFTGTEQIYWHAPKSDGCNGQGSCIAAQDKKLVSETPQDYPPGSAAVLHSLPNGFKDLNGKDVTIISHSFRQGNWPKTEVKLPDGKVAIVLSAFLRPKFKIGDQIRAYSFTRNAFSSASSSSFVQRESTEFSSTQEQESVKQIRSKMKGILVATHQLMKSISNLGAENLKRELFVRQFDAERFQEMPAVRTTVDEAKLQQQMEEKKAETSDQVRAKIKV